MSIVEANAIATVHYTGTLPGSGEIFDSSEGRDPLSFLVGHKQMIPGFEEELMGAEKGERRTFTLEPERAYGQKMDEAIQTISKDMFGDIDPEVGMTLMSDVGPFNVTAVDGDIITVDFNHKLAGETLEFSVEVVDVRPASEEELSHGHAHGPGGHEH
ncbi:peptidylprolyl isomerase [Candidatus Poseidoniales archaeon]|nr:peptidylprolyl isomerase [Candidatus Poseidoniales archaeon]MDA8715962.1 peptidylprolyl isomerase [Candidatus Poseidoniales archaeon]MDB2367432.1 peptidylprolyl isomerase [Candidatus Poseidoniales archaeon]MDB2671601.1 peptidylprolyl isomerase [Candidatus Poseidoniales archaeon]|tara:strand:+ start:4026 stop:4499 length:474 start_codon:yes stop_codon:yes gene_type:complete